MSKKANQPKDTTAITVAVIAATATLITAIVSLAMPFAERLAAEKITTPTVSPAADSALKTPVYPTVFQDDFSINRGLYVWDTERSFGGVVDGVYRVGVIGPHIVTWRVYEGLRASDFYLKASVILPRSTKLYSCGIVFRKSDQGRYLFGINNDQSYEFIKVTPSGEEITMIDWVGDIAIKPSGVNELEIIAIGAMIELYVNGEKLTALEDDTHSEGELGFYVSTYGGGDEVIIEFDDLLVEER